MIDKLDPKPIGSTYAIYGNIYHQYTPNVSIYTIHGSYGKWFSDFKLGILIWGREVKGSSNLHKNRPGTWENWRPCSKTVGTPNEQIHYDSILNRYFHYCSGSKRLSEHNMFTHTLWIPLVIQQFAIVHIILSSHQNRRTKLVGGFNMFQPTPLKTMKVVRQLGWWHSKPHRIHVWYIC